MHGEISRWIVWRYNFKYSFYLTLLIVLSFIGIFHLFIHVYLCCIMVVYHCIEISTIIMADEIIGGIRHGALPEAIVFMLPQGLI